MYMDGASRSSGWGPLSSPGLPAIDRNLQHLLQQRQRLRQDRSVYGEPSPACDAGGLRGSFETQDMSDDPLLPSRRDSSFTPDRPTMPRGQSPAAGWYTRVERPGLDASALPSPHPDPHRGSGGGGGMAAYSEAPRPGRSAPPAPLSMDGTPYHVDPAADLSGPRTAWEASGYALHEHTRAHQQHQQRQQMAELLAALDRTRQDTLVHARALLAERAALAECEDQLERERCEHMLVRSCYQRDRAYFVKYALTAVESMESCSRRELFAREAEWRSFLQLAASREAADLRATAAAIPPLDTPEAVEARDDRARPCATFVKPTMAEPPICSPRSQGGVSRGRQRPRSPPSAGSAHTPMDEGGVGLTAAALPSAGGTASARVVQCKAGLLSEVAAAKRQLEETVAALQAELESVREASRVRDAACSDRIALLEGQLRAEQELTEDMQAEMDDMLISEATAREEQERLAIAAEAATEAAFICRTLHTEAVRILSAEIAAARAAAAELRWECAQQQQQQHGAENVVSDAEGDASITLRSGTACERSPLPPDDSFVTLHDHAVSVCRSAHQPAATTPAMAMAETRAARGKHILKSLMMREPTRDHGARLSATPLEEVRRGLHEQKDALLNDLRMLQVTRPPPLPPLSPMSAATNSNEVPCPIGVEAVEVLTPVTHTLAPDSVARSGVGLASAAKHTPSPASSAGSPGVSPELAAPSSTGRVGNSRPPSSPMYSHTGSKQVRFDMPRFPPRANSLQSPSSPSFAGVAVSAATSAADDSGSEWTMTTTMSSATGTRRGVRVSGEDHFQPQALSFPSMPSNVWDLIDSDDETIPTPPGAKSHSPLSGARPSTRGKSGRKSGHPRNPYDDEDDEQ